MSKFSKYLLTPMYLHVLHICFGLLHVDMCVRGRYGCVCLLSSFAMYITVCVGMCIGL